MNAQQAREISLLSLKGTVITPYLEAVYAKIRTAANTGHRSLVNPFYGLRMPHPSGAESEAIWSKLREEGYTVTHHPDPDPGHPCSSPYTEISW